MTKFRKKSKPEIKLSTFSALCALFIVLAYHAPFFKVVFENTTGGLNAAIIPASLAVLMWGVNFFAIYLLLYLGRNVGKVILGISLLLNAAGLYFFNAIDILLDDTMMGNVFNTNTSEATSYFCFEMVAYIFLLGAIPAACIFLFKFNYGSLKKFFVTIGATLASLAGISFANITNWPWIDKNSTVLGSLILPWSYTVNSIRYANQQHELSREEILLPDATFTTPTKDVFVLVIGESARRDHFSLYGYERNTNPLLGAMDDLKVYPAHSAATYTTAGVKAILDYDSTPQYYEILPNYLHRNGAYVIWHTSNWGQSKLNVDLYQEEKELGEISSRTDLTHDDILLTGLKEQIEAANNDKVLVVIHTSTCHGPQYAIKYPEQFGVYSPVSTCVEMAKCDHQELVNGYDNTILYIDWMLSETISILKDVAADGWRTCMLYVSDHGESLGENNLYMHGVPISIAPKEQYEIPFIVWTSDKSLEFKDMEIAQQSNVFHSVMGFMGAKSEIYNPEKDIFVK